MSDALLYTPLTRDLVLLHQKRLSVPEFAKWWARYVHMAMQMKRPQSVLKLQYTKEDLVEACHRAFAALPPDLLSPEATK